MKKFSLNLWICAIVACFALSVSSCSNDNNVKPASIVITFDEEGIDAKLFVTSPASSIVPKYVHTATGLSFSANEPMPGEYSAPGFANGGILLSNFNYKSNVAGVADATTDWWYSFKNQCSVYSGTDGKKDGGVDGSKGFAVMYYNDYGYKQLDSEKFASKMQFEKGKAKVIESMFVCNSSFVYGVINNGNKLASSLETTKGYFKLLAYGYDADNKPTNSGNPVEIYLADYREGKTQVPTLDKWVKFDTSKLGEVNKIVFTVEGSDAGEYGLNTPAYVCIDNIAVAQ